MPPFVAPPRSSDDDAAQIVVELGSDGCRFLRLVALSEGDVVCVPLRSWDEVQQVVDKYIYIYIYICLL